MHLIPNSGQSLHCICELARAPLPYIYNRRKHTYSHSLWLWLWIDLSSRMAWLSIITLAAVMLGVVVMAVPSYGCSPIGVTYSVGVGDPVCWSIPPGPDYYTNWSNSHFFKIGDTLGKF